MTTIKPILRNKNGYCLRLADGQGWHIIATEGVKSWVKKLASIMELKPCDGNGYPKLIFTRNKEGKETRKEPTGGLDPKIRENFPRNGWNALKYPAIQIWSHLGVPDVICEIGHDQSHDLDILRMLLALYPIFERAQKSGALPLHAALLARNGIGVLLVASSDTGKSTCCSRLRSPWQPLCDDETLVVRDSQGRYLAHPLPTWSDHLWRGSKQTWHVEGHVPLSVIFFLEQAEIGEVVAVGQGEAAASITQSAMQVHQRNWNNLDVEDVRTFRRKLFENACELARSTPAFKLRVSLNGRFWEEIEKVLF
jgi:SynChlorMet cassette protein ScmC